MALIDDMVTNSVEITVRLRDAAYVINYKPLALTDEVRARLANSSGDSLDPLLLDLISDWEFDQIVRDQAGRPLDIHGRILTDRITQTPQIERMPVTEESLKRLATHLKLAIGQAIMTDVNNSVGNANGTSVSTPPVAGSGPGGQDVPTPGRSGPWGASPSTSAQPALVTVPSLEQRGNSR